MGLIMVLASSLTLAACQNHEKAPAKSSLPATYFSSANSASSEAQKQQIAINNFVGSLKNNYKKLFKVSYDQGSDTVTLVPISKDLKEIIKLSNQNNSEGIKAWTSFVAGLKKTSANVSKQTKDKDFKLNMTDYSDHSKILYSVQDGKVLKNAYQ
ncbi:hypothetical protein [Lactobacillus sp. Sy-1]|uniref:hypothetical protein n=1 Tax=Lactobacillus sp. Sy-1 TaxID=2109645 RepID=UPI001C5A7A2E|nr:hypothetical protein [Lactobacillus sp. Sy-1]MBW1606048.1 hypothetical protein [Lactobacillus sp. Sy-1]